MSLCRWHNAILQAHNSTLICFFRARLEMQTAAAEALDKLFLGGLLRAAGRVVALSLLLICQNVISLVEELELLRIASFVRMFVEDFGAELRSDLVKCGVAVHADKRIIIWL